MAVYAACPEPSCPGELIVGRFDTISVPALDPDGFPKLLKDGTLEKITLRLPWHRGTFPKSTLKTQAMQLAEAEASAEQEEA